MNYQTILVLLLGAYLVGLYLLWSGLREALAPIGVMTSALDRYARMRERRER